MLSEEKYRARYPDTTRSGLWYENVQFLARAPREIFCCNGARLSSVHRFHLKSGQKTPSNTSHDAPTFKLTLKTTRVVTSPRSPRESQSWRP